MVAGRRVLVVDDEAIVAESCRRVLAEQGYSVDTVLSGREGLNRAFSQNFDLVMTDLRMPDLDGMDLVRALRAKQPQTAVVIITAFGTVPSAVEATRLGVADYIEKPFTPDQLAEAVARALAPEEHETKVEIEAGAVKEVLRLAGRDPRFGARLLTEGSRSLSGFALSSEAKAAILSGDIVWIEKKCGELSSEERQWLQQRLQVETW